MKFIEIAIILAIIGLITTLASVPPLTCAAKSKQMGKHYDFGYIQGCLIEAQPGQWVPLQNYRVIEGLTK